MKPACLLALIAMTVPSIAHATHVTVPGDFATIQPALDSDADTVYVASGDFAEDLVMSRPHALLPAPTNGYNEISLPIVRSLQVDGRSGVWNNGPPPIVRGIRVRGHLTLHIDRSFDLTIEGCRIEGGLTASGATGRSLHVQYCTILGSVDINYNAVDFTLNTVLNGGISIRHEGYQVTQGNYVQGAPGIGILAQSSYYRPEVLYNTVTHCQIGISSPLWGHVEHNLVTDCSGDGYSSGPTDYDGVHLIGNRFERCGRGIFTQSIENGNVEILNNEVLASVGDGIAGVGQITGNTVVRSGGNGFSVAPGLRGRSDSGAFTQLDHNVSAFNAGFGFFSNGRGQLSCNDWFGNGAGATQGIAPGADDIQLDPLFCDLDAGDVRVSASSPLWNGSCGPIGADTVGCGMQAVVLEATRPAVARLGVRARGAIAELSLIDASPATLEVLDLQGRRVAQEEIAAPGAGTRAIVFGSRLHAGMYFLRVRQAGREASMKAIVVH